MQGSKGSGGREAAGSLVLVTDEAGYMSLYERIGALHGEQPWGDVLDAGTGPASLRWLLGCETRSITAVTGSRRMHARLLEQAGDKLRPDDALVLGNWLDQTLLEGRQFDHVIADYLLGAIDGFAPFWQDRLFARLRPLTRRRLYVVGLEPYVPFPAEDAAGAMIVEIGRLRDACLLLAGDRPYREYPLDWVLRSLAVSGFTVCEVQRVPIRYGQRFIDSQLDMCVRALDRLRDRALAVAMQIHVAETRARALALNLGLDGLRHGNDYIVVAQAAPT